MTTAGLAADGLAVVFFLLAGGAAFLPAGGAVGVLREVMGLRRCGPSSCGPQRALPSSAASSRVWCRGRRGRLAGPSS